MIDLVLSSRIDERAATISPCGLYRYWLMRRWGPGLMLYWCCLNPSTADAQRDDPSVRKMIGFAKHNGFDAIGVVNLFARRATDPRNLLLHGSKIEGPLNDYSIGCIPPEGRVVAAWGAFPYQEPLVYRVTQVKKILNRQLYCVKKTADRPWHPLYVKYGDLIDL